MNNTHKALFVAAVTALGAAFGMQSRAASEPPQPVLFGVLPVNQPQVMAQRFGPLIAYLERKTGYDFELRLYKTGSKSGGYTAAVHGLISGETPLAYLAPVTLAQARHHDERIEPLVCAVRGGSPSYVGEIVVRRDSDIHEVEDLIGRRVIGASPSSTSGNLMPSGMLIERGIDKSRFATMDFTGGHDKAARAVLVGTYDAAWINDKNFQRFKDQGVGLRAIWTHAPVPEFPIAVNTAYLDAAVQERILDALLAMHSKDPDGLKAIDPKYERWVAVDWQAYRPVKETIDRVHGSGFYELKD
jgi:phosphonate transport system substrate-binding protein